MRATKGFFPFILVCLLIIAFMRFLDDDRESDGLEPNEKTVREHEQTVTVNESLEDDDGNTETKSRPKDRRLPATSKRRMNVFLMMTDDMRAQLGCYAGEDFVFPSLQVKMSTPNLDRLAAKSLLLRRAYAQYSLCGPSRTSMLTSRRPDTTRIYGNDVYWRNVGGNFTTLPQYFKAHDYHVIGLGKVFHQHRSSNNQDPISWTEPYFHPIYTDLDYYPLDRAGYKAVTPELRQAIKQPLTDETAIEHVRHRLAKIAPAARDGTKPFFIALGFCKPHLNFVCPSEFFEHYPLEKRPQYLPVREWQTPPVSQYCHMANVTEYEDGVKHLTDVGLRHLRQAYSACISYVDSLVGQVLDLIDEFDLAESTIVVFVADHGHHNGENNAWGKQTNYEIATHIPMMMHIPGRTDQGIVSRSLVEAVDLYPTIVEAAGLGILPPCPEGSSNVSVCTHGQSLLPLVDDPEAPIHEAVFHQVRQGQYTAYAIRTSRYRYVAYAKTERRENDDGTDTYTNNWNHDAYWTELYDLREDPEERFNQTNSAKYQVVKHRLEKRLRNFFTGAINVLPAARTA